MTEKKSYHHGDLRETLILNGIKLLNETGIEGFSLRKVASMSGVSHSAPYKHFKNKEALVAAINDHVNSSFEVSLKQVVFDLNMDPGKQIVEMGKAYVLFMVRNPDYLTFLFLGKHSGTIFIKNGRFEPVSVKAFEVFKKSAESYLDRINAPQNNRVEPILAMWSMVHGLAVLFSNQAVAYDGNLEALVENILINHLNFYTVDNQSKITYTDKGNLIK